MNLKFYLKERVLLYKHLSLHSSWVYFAFILGFTLHSSLRYLAPILHLSCVLKTPTRKSASFQQIGLNRLPVGKLFRPEMYPFPFKKAGAVFVAVIHQKVTFV